MFLTSVGLRSLAILTHASQTVLGWQPPTGNTHAQSTYTAPDEGLLTPMGHLTALSYDCFTSLGHPTFSNYNVRIKKTVFACDQNRDAYTGYIDIEARHLFFYFFENRHAPATDDIMLWIDGGPGCVSSMGLFMESGPCKILDDEGPKYNPYSWTTNASVFYVDQPVGVGYSYAEYGEYVSTTQEAAKDIAAFLAIFFEHFTDFQGRAFHMVGESYAGHYLPIFAAKVYDQNAQLVQVGGKPINLQSVMIGNGIVDYYTLYPTYFDVQCTTASISPPVSSIRYPFARNGLTSRVSSDLMPYRCSAARNLCENELSLPFAQLGLNYYDMSKKCEGDFSVHCYPVMQYMNEYLALQSTRDFLGVDPVVPTDFQACNHTVRNAFFAALDQYHETYSELAQLLERGVRVLVFAGTYDWICNWVSNERWTLQMPWSGQAAFASQPLTDWQINGHTVGKQRSANGLTFATVDGAGHMVPIDKPVEALMLVHRWLAKQPL